MLPKKNAAEKKAWKNAAEEYDENCWKLWIESHIESNEFVKHYIY